MYCIPCTWYCVLYTVYYVLYIVHCGDRWWCNQDYSQHPINSSAVSTAQHLGMIGKWKMEDQTSLSPNFCLVIVNIYRDLKGNLTRYHKDKDMGGKNSSERCHAPPYDRIVPTPSKGKASPSFSQDSAVL